MNTHADKTQENKSSPVLNSKAQMKRGDESIFQFVESGPEEIDQRKLQELANNSPQVSHLRSFQDIFNNSHQVKQLNVVQETANNQILRNQSTPRQPKEFIVQLGKMDKAREKRAITRAASMPYADPHSRTRGAAKHRAVREGANLPEQRRNLTGHPFTRASDNTPLWNGISRPSWGDVEENFYSTQVSQNGTKADGTARREYLCIISNNRDTKFLPRRKDADDGEDTASIGHKKQWRDYIADNAVTERWPVEGGEILAISLAEAERCYRNNENLELQGQAYNSSIASAYTSGPPGQDWIKE